MRGHVRRRGNGWAYIVDVGHTPARRCTNCGDRQWAEGSRWPATCTKCGSELGDVVKERRQVWKSGYSTRKAAEADLRALRVAVDDGADPFPATQTVAQWVERWFSSERVASLRVQTRNRYRQLIDADMLPALGEMQLADVRPRHIAFVLDRLASRGLSARTITQCRAVMSSCMRAALEAELISANPVAATRPPKTARPDLQVPTAEQLASLIAGARDTPWEIPMILACSTGMRRSEVLAVRWAGVDLAAGRIGTEAGLHRDRDGDGSRLALHANKTDRSRRVIAAPAVTIERLRRHKVEQAERRLRIGPGWVDTDLVCDRGDGGPLDPDAFSIAFKRLAARAGLPTAMRLHDVRHGVATVLLERGVHSAIASALLGHASLAFTMAVYQHVNDNMTAKAAAELDDALGG